MKKEFVTRIRILSLVIVSVFLLFATKLVQYQIIEGEKHFENSNTSVVFKQTLAASRGDIVDKNGTPIASSQIIFNVVLNKASLKNENLNERISQVIEILEANGENINDILPLEKSYPYNFIEEKTSEIEWVRKTLELNIYATSNDVLDKLTERYSLEEYSDDIRRKIGGVRYTMEREGYALSYPFTIAEDVSEKSVAVIIEKSRQLSGVEIYDTSKRYYEDGTLIPHVLGTVGPIYAEEYEELKKQGYKMNDTLGKSGLEKAYESYLKGSDGTVQIERNMYGEITGKEVIVEPKEGDTVKLTIDYELQKKVNQILAHQVEVLHQKSETWGKETEGISAVVVDVETGGILAIANYPNYDLNLYSSNYSEYANDPMKPLFNRALQGLYRPGSVYKCAVAIAALQEGIITEDTKINCTGRYMYYAPSYTPSCANGKVHGNINVKEALQVSCNNFFFEVGRQLGIEKMNEIAYQFGMGVKTGVEISEQKGVLSSPQHTESLGGTWQAGDVIQAAIGQMNTSLTTTQLATYAATLANKGNRLNTHILDSIISVDGEVVYKTPIDAVSKLPDVNNSYSIVEKGMLMASQQGAAKIFLQDMPYGVASKTGTAQVPGGYYNATMMAYGPTEKPKIAIGIIAEKAGNGYFLAESVRDIFMAYDHLTEVRKNSNWKEILEQEELEAQAQLEAKKENKVDSGNTGEQYIRE